MKPEIAAHVELQIRHKELLEINSKLMKWVVSALSVEY